MNKKIAEAEEKETGRVEAFSDGIFAVAVTLLVFDLKVPPHAEGSVHGTRLAHHLAQQWPAFLSYVTSFLTILVLWINHHRMFTHIKRVDHNLMILNGLLMMGITLVPFPTEMIAEYIATPDAVTAMTVYNGLFLAIAILYNLIWHYARRDMRLLGAGVNLDGVSAIDKQYRFGPIIYALTLVLGFFHVVVSLSMCLALAVYFALPSRSEMRSR